MARPDNKYLTNNIARDLLPETQRAFLNSVQRLVNTASLADLEAAIAAGNVDRAVALLRITPDHFDEVRAAIQKAYIEGGGIAFGTIPAGQLTPQLTKATFVFNGNRDAEAKRVSDQYNRFIRDITPTTERAIRSTISEGISSGRAIPSVARDLVGLIDDTGNRVGGVLGLTAKDARTIQSIDRGFRVGDKRRISSFYRLEVVDKALANRVKGWVAEGGGTLTDAQIAEVRAVLRNRYLFKRATDVARTEILTALSAGRFTGYDRLVEDKIARSLTKRWHTNIDERTRVTHIAVDGVIVPYDEPFVLPDGDTLQFPRDREHGARASNIINCRCYVQITADFIDYSTEGAGDG